MKDFMSMKQVFRYYFDQGNLLDTEQASDEEDTGEKLIIEYLDGSKYKGSAIINERKGTLIKHGEGGFERKPKNNNSYMQSFVGKWKQDVPDC